MKNVDEMDGKRYVEVKIKYIYFDEPILSFDTSKQYIRHFRSVHRIEDTIISQLMDTALKSIV